MDSESSNFKTLFQKHLDGTAEPEEIRELFRQIRQEEKDNEILSSLDEELTETDLQNPYDQKRWDIVFERIKDDTAAIGGDSLPVRKRGFGFLKISIAAAITFIVLGAGFFYFVKRNNGEIKQTVFANDIAPGKMGATLTLASGKKIKLSDASNGQLAQEAGLTITKSADGQLIYSAVPPGSDTDNKINTLSTANGETYMLTLPDKSKVWMNAASSLTYATSLNERGERKVKLTGEAYFEISKDKAHPFIVESNGQEVRVLGTHFNINAYPDENSFKTTLLEGSVRISSLSGKKQTLVLRPDQQAVFKNNLITAEDVVSEDAVAWKQGFFMFNNENLSSAMTRIARWYNVKLIYEDEQAKAGIYFGTISRYEHISKVLQMLEKVGLVEFKIDGDTVRIKKKK